MFNYTGYWHNKVNDAIVLVLSVYGGWGRGGGGGGSEQNKRKNQQQNNNSEHRLSSLAILFSSERESERERDRVGGGNVDTTRYTSCLASNRSLNRPPNLHQPTPRSGNNFTNAFTQYNHVFSFRSVNKYNRCMTQMRKNGHWSRG